MLRVGGWITQGKTKRASSKYKFENVKHISPWKVIFFLRKEMTAEGHFVWKILQISNKQSVLQSSWGSKKKDLLNFTNIAKKTLLKIAISIEQRIPLIVFVKRIRSRLYIFLIWDWISTEVAKSKHTANKQATVSWCGENKQPRAIQRRLMLCNQGMNVHRWPINVYKETHGEISIKMFLILHKWTKVSVSALHLRSLLSTGYVLTCHPVKTLSCSF